MASTSAAKGDTGSSSIELVLIFPVTLFVALASVQFALWYHCADIARAAAQEGVKAASSFGAGADAGRSAASVVLAENGTSLLASPSVVVERGPDDARVTVTGRALSVVPVIHLSVSESATAPAEAFRPPTAP